jgi:hypothetical protein
MSWDDEGLRRRYSDDAYGGVLELLKSDDIDSQLSGLQALGDTLAYADEHLLSSFPIRQFSQLIVQFMQSPIELIQESASRCVFLLLEAHPQSARELLSAGALPHIHRILTEFGSISVAENLLKACEALSRIAPGPLANEVGIAPMLPYIDFFTVVEQRVIVKACEQMTDQAFDPGFPELLPQLLQMVSSPDGHVSRHALRTCCAIARKVDPGGLPRETVVGFCETVEIVSERRQLLRVVEVLARLTQAQVVGAIVIEVGLNFEKLLFAKDPDSAIEIIQQTMSLALNLLPPARIPTRMLRPRTGAPPNARDFAVFIQPLLIRGLTERIGEDYLLITALAVSLAVHYIEIPVELINVLCGLTQQASLPPFILLFAESLQNLEIVARSGLLALLKSSPVTSDDTAAWYSEHLKALCEAIGTATEATEFDLIALPTLRAVLTCLIEGKVAPFEVLKDGVLERLAELVGSADPEDFPLFEKFVPVLISILLTLPIQSTRDPFGPSFADLKGRTYRTVIETDGEQMEYNHLVVDALLGAEGLYNYRRSFVNDGMVAEARDQAGRLGEIIQLPDDVEDLSSGEIGVLHRVLKTPSYRRTKLTLDGRAVSRKDGMLRFFTEPRFERALMMTAIETTEEDEFETLSPFEVNTALVEGKMLRALNVLAAIHDRVPSLNLFSASFEKRIAGGLTGPFLILTRLCPEVQIVANFPFLFSSDLRAFIFKATATDTLSSLSAIFRRLTGRKLVDAHNHIKCQVSRDRLFEDGILLIKSIAAGQFDPEILFEGEPGVGIGPTQEFFALFAREFAFVSRGLWRNDFSNTSIYAHHSKGLFPVLTANPDLFFALGILCGKAVQLGFLVPLPFNVAFFRLVKGEPISLGEVDPAIAQSLACPDGLLDLPFVLLGTDIPLVENGEALRVTTENVGDYIAAVTDHICGSKLKPIADAFARGFANIFQPGAWELLTAEELCSIISGTGAADLTMEDLVDNIQLSNGYAPSSGPVQMLFQLLLSWEEPMRALFFKFVTGSERLPIGGLAALEPRLTIAKKVGCDDSALPSAVTCTHYFKLPPYATREEMAEKVGKAVLEGQGEFFFS